MAEVRRSDAKADFQSARSDQEVGEGNTNPVRLTQSVDLSGTESDKDGDRLDRNTGE